MSAYHDVDGLLQELATNIFSTSIIPYSAFLYYLTKSKKAPPLALFGFYFLLVFVFATIPAGIIGKPAQISAMFPIHCGACSDLPATEQRWLCYVCSPEGLPQKSCQC